MEPRASPELHAQRFGMPESLSTRAETTYLHIIGGLLRLLLGQSPGNPYSSFKTQESIVSAMVAHFGGEFMGHY
jgi:hypothetical protein